MDKRKEMKEAFNPEKINFVAVIDSLNWCREVTPVDLVKAVNNVEGLRGRKKYETNEKSFGLLIKCFEKIVGDFVTTRINGKDRFYTLKPEYKPTQLVHYARTGEVLEIKEELKKKDPKFYIPEVPESMMSGTGEVKAKRSTKKRIFPDCEAMAKSAILLSLLKNGEGKVESRIFNEIRDKFGWKYQRSIEGKPYTSYLEVNRFCADYLDLGKDLIKLDKKDNHYKYTGDITILDGKIKDTLTLMEDEDLKKKVQEFIAEPEAKAEEELKPEVKVKMAKPEPKKETVEDKKPEPKTETMPRPKRFETKPTSTERPRIFKASPEVGKSEFRETGSAPSTLYEGSKTRWYKSLIANTLKGAERGVWYNFSDISQIIKKTRFVEISTREIKDLCGEVSKQWKGIFREVDFGGVTVGSEVLVKDFIEAYPAEKITESIFLRLHMSIDELQETYPELNVKIASEISEKDNIVEIEMNRAEKTEKAFAKLVFRMRQGEIILESPSNWTIKRTRILIDKLFGGM
jgi:hypothetical protein